MSNNQILIGFFLILTLLSGCKFAPESQIPILSINDIGSEYEFHLSTPVSLSESEIEGKSEARISFISIDSRVDIAPNVPETVNLHLRGTLPPGTYDDISGVRIATDVVLNQYSFTVSKEKFSGPLLITSLFSGSISVGDNKKTFLSRIFHRNNFDLLSAIQPNIKNTPEKASEIVLPVTVFDFRSTSWKQDKELMESRLERVIQQFNKIWGIQCGITLNIRSIYTPDHETSYTFPLGINPELIGLVRGIQNNNATILSESLLIIQGKPIEFDRSDIGELGINGAVPEGFAFKLKNWPFKIFKTESLSLPKNIVYTYSTYDEKTIPHEIGHIILEQGHDSDPRSLMHAERSRGTNLTSDQCSKAKSYIRTNFKNALQ